MLLDKGDGHDQYNLDWDLEGSISFINCYLLGDISALHCYPLHASFPTEDLCVLPSAVFSDPHVAHHIQSLPFLIAVFTPSHHPSGVVMKSTFPCTQNWEFKQKSVSLASGQCFCQHAAHHSVPSQQTEVGDRLR